MLESKIIIVLALCYFNKGSKLNDQIQSNVLIFFPCHLIVHCKLSPDLQKDWPKKSILRGVAGTLGGGVPATCLLGRSLIISPDFRSCTKSQSQFC